MKNILITTKKEHGGVFLAQAKDDADLTEKSLANLENVIMVINWRNGKGVQGVAADGPKDCKLSAITNAYVIHDVTAVFAVSDAAAKLIWG